MFHESLQVSRQLKPLLGIVVDYFESALVGSEKQLAVAAVDLQLDGVIFHDLIELAHFLLALEINVQTLLVLLKVQPSPIFPYIDQLLLQTLDLIVVDVSAH